QAEDGIRDFHVTGVQTCALPIWGPDGKKLGEHVFVGLMSTKALKQVNRRVPVVGKRIKEVMSKLEDPPGSYAYTKSVAIVDSMRSEERRVGKGRRVGGVGCRGRK